MVNQSGLQNAVEFTACLTSDFMIVWLRTWQWLDLDPYPEEFLQKYLKAITSWLNNHNHLFLSIMCGSSVVFIPWSSLTLHLLWLNDAITRGKVTFSVPPLFISISNGGYNLGGNQGHHLTALMTVQDRYSWVSFSICFCGDWELDILGALL